MRTWPGEGAAKLRNRIAVTAAIREECNCLKQPGIYADNWGRQPISLTKPTLGNDFWFTFFFQSAAYYNIVFVRWKAFQTW
jgi:hypothetical protein